MPLSEACLSISAQLVVGEGEAVERCEVLLELGDARGADEGRGDAGVAERPGERHLGERLAAGFGDLVQGADLAERLIVEEVGRERALPARPRAFRHLAGEVAAGEHPLGERGEADAADPELAERVEQALGLDPAVQHRVRRLVDEDRRAETAHDLAPPPRSSRPSRTRSGVERLALADGGVERAHRLLERRVRVEAVRVEDVDVVELHAPQALVEAREQVLARAAVAVRARPHVVAGLRRDRRARRGSRRDPCAGCGRSSPRPSRTAGRSCWRGRSA